MRKQMAMQKAGQEGDEESMPPPEPVDPVKAAFERAARKLRDQKSDELPPDDKVLYWLDRWCQVRRGSPPVRLPPFAVRGVNQESAARLAHHVRCVTVPQEWKEDLDARDVAAKETSRGKHATNLYKTSMIYFRPLREELEQRTLKQDVLIGLIIMVDAMRCVCSETPVDTSSSRPAQSRLAPCAPRPQGPQLPGRHGCLHQDLHRQRGVAHRRDAGRHPAHGLPRQD